jgi:hypothetical protein
MEPLDLVAIGLVKPSWTAFSFAITLDVATHEVCGIGVHTDPERARAHAIFDTIRDNGWCVAHGRPKAFASYCDRPLDTDRVIADMCGSKLRYLVPDGFEVIDDATRSLRRHLDAELRKGQSFEKVYCETIMWATQQDRLPGWDWWQMHEHAGELPPFLAALELPVADIAPVLSGGQIECKGKVYEHRWLETFTEQALPYHQNYWVCHFPGNDRELWVLDDSGCFAATRVLAAESMPAPPKS